MTCAKVGDRVRIRYSRLNSHGTLTAAGLDAPLLEFTVGCANLMTRLSLGVVGMTVGDRKRLWFPPEEAYGAVLQELIQAIPRHRCRQRVVLRIGKRVNVIKAATGERRRVRIVAIRADAVIVDGNHPLAGRTVAIELTLVSLFSTGLSSGAKPRFVLAGEP
jgi:FKBP-type peptidyl-prolyl cis-trans isomerases 2